MSELTAHLDLPLGPEAPRAARHAVHSMLYGWGIRDERWLYTTTLVVSELVTNAVRHGGGCVALDLRHHEGRVTVGVADGSSVVPRRRPADEEGGRGMGMIEKLADRWGVENHHGGKRVWALFPPYPGADAGCGPSG